MKISVYIDLISEFSLSPCNSTVPNPVTARSKGHYTVSVKLSDFTICHTWPINWVNCVVLTGNSTGLRTVLSSRLSHRELRSSLSESNSFLSLLADTTMVSSQGTWPSKMKEMRPLPSLNRTDRYVNFGTQKIGIILAATESKSLANSKRHSRFYTPWSIVQEDTQNWQKTDKPDGKPVLGQRTFSSVFRTVFFYTVKLYSLT